MPYFKKKVDEGCVAGDWGIASLAGTLSYINYNFIRNMADRDDLLQQFSTITGVDAGRSRFHLESASWNLQVNTNIRSMSNMMKTSF